MTMLAIFRTFPIYPGLFSLLGLFLSLLFMGKEEFESQNGCKTLAYSIHKVGKEMWAFSS